MQLIARMVLASPWFLSLPRSGWLTKRLQQTRHEWASLLRCLGRAAQAHQRWLPCAYMNQSTEIPELIKRRVADDLVILPSHLQTWVRTHLVVPRMRRFSVDHDGSSFKQLWLVTDHNGKHDSSYRIVFDGEQGVFGLECTLETGVEWYMGSYGSFSDAVENM